MTLLRRQDVLRLLLSSAILQAVLHHRLVLRVHSPVLPVPRQGLHHHRPARPALRHALPVLRPRCVLQVRRHAVPAVLTSPVRAHPRPAAREVLHRHVVPVPPHRSVVQAPPHKSVVRDPHLRSVARAPHPSPVLPAQGPPVQAPLLRCVSPEIPRRCVALSQILI